MDLDFFNSPYGDPAGELPSEKLERAMAFRNGLVALCEGRSNMNGSIYRLLRRDFMDDPASSHLLPPFVRSIYDVAAMWAFLKGHSGQWEPRRQFVRDHFAPLIDQLERSPAPADAVVSDALQKFDTEGISDAWNKALSRREADPASAITAARTLLESVCKHLLEDAEGNPTYGAKRRSPKAIQASGGTAEHRTVAAL